MTVFLLNTQKRCYVERNSLHDHIVKSCLRNPPDAVLLFFSRPPRNSIGDEIIGLGELNDVSPLCGKSNNNNDDSDCSPIKNATDAADMPDANPDAFPPPSATAETSRGPEQKFEIRQEEGNEEEDIFLSGLGAGVVEVSSPVVFPVRRSEVGTQTDPLPSLKRKRVMFDDTEEDEVLKDVEETENGGKGSHWWSKR